MEKAKPSYSQGAPRCFRQTPDEAMDDEAMDDKAMDDVIKHAKTQRRPK